MKLTNIRKIFLLGDLHLGIKSGSIEWSEIQLEFLLNHFIEQVDAEGFDPETDILFQAGDWNHVRESTNVRIQNLSLELADALAKKFKRGIFLILGNHDVYYKDRTDTHSLKGYDRIFPNFTIFETAEILHVNSHKFLMLPWIEDHAELKSTVALYSAADFLFCHADIQGFNFNPVAKLEKGLLHEDLVNFKRVYSGHIHIRQNRNNVLYVGTPYEMDRGDRGNQKGFYVLDVSGATVKEKFVENNFSPKYKKFEMLDLLNLRPAEVETQFKNNFVDVSIESSFAANFPVTKFTELVKDYGHRKLEFFSYSKELMQTKSEIELDSNYEYNIFSILDERLKASTLSPQLTSKVVDKFKEVYDTVKSAKSYDQ